MQKRTVLLAHYKRIIAKVAAKIEEADRLPFDKAYEKAAAWARANFIAIQPSKGGAGSKTSSRPILTPEQQEAQDKSIAKWNAGQSKRRQQRFSKQREHAEKLAQLQQLRS